MTGTHLAKRSFSLAGHRTSVALEPPFWRVLEAEALRRGRSLAALVAAVDADRSDPTLPLASALRVFALAARCQDRSDPYRSDQEDQPPCSSP
ncbi:ribbon-helix-helix domain-containing protein [Roseomonas sp. NAR14]|uniref:Ribbon-helix-helix domain-containing protein n=1 Tax=Roseomonas acroporae TaxID=2937791 RepID=A0A9X1Y5E1_9PROT|nr:ribbon-helix-helix domain-containing protein [Roseomonas acroporae]MCK8783427.1 ribbon-helix-helix domain-containing protein [Roseomonas acroporae]